MGTIVERKTGKGKTVFIASVRRQGFPKSYQSFSRLTDAKLWIQDLEFKMRSGISCAQPESERHTFTDAIDRFILEELPKQPKNLPNQKVHLLWFKKQLGFKVLADISPALLTELKGKFLRETSRNNKLRKPQTWNRYMTSISCVFEACCRDWQWLDLNPTRRVRREREAPGRVRFLSEEERTKLLEACKNSSSPNLYPLVVLTLSTGMRRGEVKWLTWQQVDLANGIIILSETKNGDHRRVSMRGLALDLMRQHAKVRHLTSEYVFPGEETGRTGEPFALQTFWRKAINESGLE